MADKKNKYKENQKGKYFVDDTCISCDACHGEAPEFFVQATDDQTGHSYVSKQPETPEDIAKCENALSACPVNAIGNDGEEEANEEEEASPTHGLWIVPSFFPFD